MDWGDLVTQETQRVEGECSTSPLRQTLRFDHAYSEPGTYRIEVTVSTSGLCAEAAPTPTPAGASESVTVTVTEEVTVG